MKITCGPKRPDGTREVVNKACSSRCPFYEQCCGELGITPPETEMIELDPTERELIAGIGHLNSKGDIKVWHQVKV